MLRHLLALSATILFSCSVQAENAYVSDNLFAYMHTGPGTGYKIIGSVNAGKLIQLSGESSDGFTKIKDERGREGWIQSKMLQSNQSFRFQVAELEQQLAQQQQQVAEQLTQQQQLVADEQATTSALRNQLTELEGRYQALQAKLDETTQVLNQSRAEVASYDDETKMQWFIRGAAVLGGGLLFGILIPFLPRRKKRNDQWA